MLRAQPRPAEAGESGPQPPEHPGHGHEPPAYEPPAYEPPAYESQVPEAQTAEVHAPASLVPEAPEPAPEAPEPAPEAPEPAPEAPQAAPAAAEYAPEAPERALEAPEPAPEASEAPEAPEASEAPENAPENAPEVPAPVAARLVGVERGRPLPSIERALSGPGSRGDATSWRRQVKVVAGGQGPGKRDQETLDRDRARLPLAAPSLIAVLGCTRGAGQTVTALMTSHILATVRGIGVAALDLNPGPTSLAARHAPAVTVHDLLAGTQFPGREPGAPPQPELLAGPGPGARLDVIAGQPGNGALEGAGFGRLAGLLTERYSLTMIDPSPSGLTRVLAAADQLILVAPASPDAATALANTQQWLGAHGHGELAARAVTVVNGVSRRTMEDVLRAESVARGRCRAIVRVPWDDHLAPGGRPSGETLQPQTRLAYTALAGVLVAALSAAAASPVPGRNPGEHSH